MPESVTFHWLFGQLAERMGLSPQDAMEIVRTAMISGELSAVAPRLTYLPQNEATIIQGINYGRRIDYKIPPELWKSLRVDWEEGNLYPHFYDEYGVYLAPKIDIASSDAYKFIKSRDPVLQASPIAADREPAVSTGTKGAGGAPRKVDWEKCLIEAARWMYAGKTPDKQADLIRHVANWLGPAAPGETQLKAHLAPLWRAFRNADSEQ